MSKYYVKGAGEDHGPFEVEQLANLCLDSTTLVRRDGAAEWRVAAEVEEVAAAIRSPMVAGEGPHWGDITAKGCNGTSRTYSAILWGIPWGQSWEGACAVMPATIKGQYFPHPTRCINTVTAMWGEWDVPDGTCGVSPSPVQDLNLNEQHQQQSEWCWSASTVSITLFYDPSSTWTQCTLVNKAFGLSNCCSNGSSSSCNQPWFPENALKITGHWASTAGGKPTFTSVMAEITARHPISVNIQWHGGGGHNPVVDGYDNTNPATPMIDLEDPWYGHSVQDFNSFPGSYQGGANWAASYLTKP